MYDAVIVGGGHNALVCGAYLAKAGRKAVVLERRSLIGGACVTEESLARVQGLDSLICDVAVPAADHSRP